MLWKPFLNIIRYRLLFFVLTAYYCTVGVAVSVMDPDP
jgi:hypothetical protein